MIVIDASAAIELLLNPSPPVVQRLLGGDPLAAPHLIDVEVVQVFRRLAARGDLDEQRAQEAIQDLLDLPMQRYPHDVLLPRVWQLRGNLTAYDAVYIALAEGLGGTLVTRDGRLAASPGHSAVVELI
jgi:predicted nucleic acid-binding protein